jgi:hypothetical protein
MSLDTPIVIRRPRVAAAAVLILVAVSGVLGGMSLERWMQVRRFERAPIPPQGGMMRGPGGGGGGGGRGERGPLGMGGRGPSRMRDDFARELGLSPQPKAQVD